MIRSSNASLLSGETLDERLVGRIAGRESGG